MSNFYDHSHYRPLIKEFAQRWKEEHAGWTLNKIAAKAGIQAPYFTNVLKERAHLSSDQLFGLAKVFAWDEGEVEYASQLLEWERSGNPQRREWLRSKIEATRREKLSSKAHLKKQVVDTSSEEFARYFLNPFFSLIDTFLAVPKFSKDPKRISRCLSLDTTQVQTLIKELVSMGFLAPSNEGYQKLKKNFHLPKDSPYCEPYLFQLRQIAMQHSQALPPEQKYNFTVTFNADPATREKIQREFLSFLKQVENWVKDAPPMEVYNLSFDLFQWSHERVIR